MGNFHRSPGDNDSLRLVEAPPPPPTISKTQRQQESRAESQMAEEQRQLAARRNVRRTGGMRMLFSPLRQDQEALVEGKTTLGG